MRRALMVGVALVAIAGPVLAYVEYPTATGPVGAAVQMTLDGSGTAQPVSSTNPLPAGITANQTISQTVQTAAYTIGNSVGGLMSFTSAARSGKSSGLLQNVLIAMPDAQTPTLDVFLFNANPSASTITDRTAFSVAAADQSKIRGIVHMSDCTNMGTGTFCQQTNLAAPFALVAGQTLYAAIVARNAFTPTGTPTWQVTISVLQD